MFDVFPTYLIVGGKQYLEFDTQNTAKLISACEFKDLLYSFKTVEGIEKVKIKPAILQQKPKIGSMIFFLSGCLKVRDLTIFITCVCGNSSTRVCEVIGRKIKGVEIVSTRTAVK